MAARPATEKMTSQANRSGWDRSAGGENSRPTLTTVGRIAAIISGRRRPSLDLRLSDQDPMKGSTTASKASPIARAAPTRAPERPRTTE